MAVKKEKVIGINIEVRIISLYSPPLINALASLTLLAIMTASVLSHFGLKQIRVSSYQINFHFYRMRLQKKRHPVARR